MGETMSNIRRRRRDLTLSQEALAEKLGVTQSAVSYYERSETDIGSSIVISLARALECSADYLLGLTSDPTPAHLPGDLTAEERAIIEALRAGDRMGAMRLITLLGE
jgi:transcriptional regulator with XRE-family HTH domain